MIAEKPFGMVCREVEVDDPLEVIPILESPAGRQALDRET